MPSENPTHFSFSHSSTETAAITSPVSSGAVPFPIASVRSTIKGATAIRDILDEVLEPAPLRRDFNLVRAILLEAEQPGVHPFMYPNYDRMMVQTHLMLLIEAGFAHGTVVRNGNGVTTANIERLTWSGHDLLALMKTAPLWERARTMILDAHGCAHTDLLIGWLKSQKTAR